jgi:hypothetical protein
MIDRQEARSDVARIDPAADRWLHTANRARATTDPRVLFGFNKLVCTVEKQCKYGESTGKMQTRLDYDIGH